MHSPFLSLFSFSLSSVVNPGHDQHQPTDKSHILVAVRHTYRYGYGYGYGYGDSCRTAAGQGKTARRQRAGYRTWTDGKRLKAGDRPRRNRKCTGT